MIESKVYCGRIRRCVFPPILEKEQLSTSDPTNYYPRDSCNVLRVTALKPQTCTGSSVADVRSNPVGAEERQQQDSGASDDDLDALNAFKAEALRLRDILANKKKKRKKKKHIHVDGNENRDPKDVSDKFSNQTDGAVEDANATNNGENDEIVCLKAEAMRLTETIAHNQKRKKRKKKSIGEGRIKPSKLFGGESGDSTERLEKDAVPDNAVAVDEEIAQKIKAALEVAKKMKKTKKKKTDGVNTSGKNVVVAIKKKKKDKKTKSKAIKERKQAGDSRAVPPPTDPLRRSISGEVDRAAFNSDFGFDDTRCATCEIEMAATGGFLIQCARW